MSEKIEDFLETLVAIEVLDFARLVRNDHRRRRDEAKEKGEADKYGPMPKFEELVDEALKEIGSAKDLIRKLKAAPA